MRAAPIRRKCRRTRMIPIAVIAAGLAMVPAFARSAAAEGAFTLTSAAFKDGGWLSVKNAGRNPKNPNCIGDNVAPPLAWTDPPAGTKSYALLMFDSQGDPPDGVSHWVAYGIPASVTGLAEGEASKLAVGYVDGENTIGRLGYYGPCPPRESPHHYVITLFATTLPPQALPRGLNRGEVIKALKGHVVGVAGIVGVFGR